MAARSREVRALLVASLGFVALAAVGLTLQEDHGASKLAVKGECPGTTSLTTAYAGLVATPRGGIDQDVTDLVGHLMSTYHCHVAGITTDGGGWHQNSNGGPVIADRPMISVDFFRGATARDIRVVAAAFKDSGLFTSVDRPSSDAANVKTHPPSGRPVATVVLTALPTIELQPKSVTTRAGVNKIVLINRGSSLRLVSDDPGLSYFHLDAVSQRSGSPGASSNSKVLLRAGRDYRIFSAIPGQRRAGLEAVIHIPARPTPPRTPRSGDAADQ